ncbi:MAG: hypothetical protein ACLUZ4_04155 [Christensenellaceae bacterium]
MGALAGGKASLAYLGGALVKPCKVTSSLTAANASPLPALNSAFCTPRGIPRAAYAMLSKKNVDFSGDTLFRLSVGRTDLDGGDNDALYNSLLLLTGRLKGDYRVFPGHMGETTLDFERKHNPYLRGGGNQDY